ncbi:MAG TPA: hypothetical protein VFQ38_18235 [Longimicrobiales bacterium]|nr:hypothetical protein [Longimicrobiales bacterium]
MRVLHGVAERARRRVGVCIAAALAAGCQGDGVAAPGASAWDGAACGPATVVRLEPLQAATLDCGAGTTVTLAGNGAAYLLVPQFATDAGPPRASGYTIGATSEPAAAREPAPASEPARPNARSPGSAPRSAAPAPPTEPRPRALPAAPAHAAAGAFQLAFDAALRAHELHAAAARPEAPRSVASPRRAVVPPPPPPPLGSSRSFSVLMTAGSRPTFRPVVARLVYAGSAILLYQDTRAPADGFTAPQLARFGELFDEVLYPLAVATFGEPSDIDANGRLIVLLSPAVNAVTPAAECAAGGFLGGFFTGYDLTSTHATSNRGEIFYAAVPDAGGAVSCSHSVAELERAIPAVFLHELQHLISFSQHVVVRRGPAEAPWLNEALSKVAEELGSLRYERQAAASARTPGAGPLFPDSARAYILPLLSASYRYLLRTDTSSLTLRTDDDPGLAWRGGAWLLLRWLGDQKGQADFYRRLEQTTLTGTANIAAAAGEPFRALFADFSLSLYTDSLPGLPKSAIPARNRFATRTLRRIYQEAAGAAFPIAPLALPARGTVTASMLPGTMAFYRLVTPAGAATVTVTLAAPGGGPLAAGLRPQLGVFRLPAGP